jgi:pentatricopeptide repeat protein
LYAFLTDAYVKLGDCESVRNRPNVAKIHEYKLSIPQESCRKVLDDQVYNILGDAYAKLGDWESVQTVIRTMQEKGVRPSVITVNTLLDGMARGDAPLQSLMDVYKGMLRAGGHASSFTYRYDVTFAYDVMFGLWRPSSSLPVCRFENTQVGCHIFLVANKQQPLLLVCCSKNTAVSTIIRMTGFPSGD